MGRKYNGLTPKQVDLLVPGIVKLYTERPVDVMRCFQGERENKVKQKLKVT